MLDYIYDGSFDGLLTAVYEAYYRKETPERIMSEQSYQENLLSTKLYVETDTVKANKVYQAIKNKISYDALKNVFYVFLSELPEAGTIIYHYLKLGWKIGNQVDKHLTDERVLTVHDISRKVGRERHLMLGFIRFRQLEGNIYYAPMEPQYNIVGLVAGHFASRLANQNWIIHDVRRGLGAVYNRKEWIITNIDVKELKFSEEERNYQQLWKEYFNNIAIKHRFNPVLQKSNMPTKYWKHLVELT